MVDTEPPKQIQVWILTLPDKRLWVAPISKSELVLEWRESLDIALLAFTYFADTGFRTSYPLQF